MSGWTVTILAAPHALGDVAEAHWRHPTLGAVVDDGRRALSCPPQRRSRWAPGWALGVLSHDTPEDAVRRLEHLARARGPEHARQTTGPLETT